MIERKEKSCYDESFCESRECGECTFDQGWVDVGTEITTTISDDIKTKYYKPMKGE